jgi:hypothetical protein
METGHASGVPSAVLVHPAWVSQLGPDADVADRIGGRPDIIVLVLRAYDQHNCAGAARVGNAHVPLGSNRSPPRQGSTTT